MTPRYRVGLASLIYLVVLYQYGGHITHGVVLWEGDRPLMTAPYIESVREMAAVALLAGATAYLLMTVRLGRTHRDGPGMTLAATSLALGLIAVITAAGWALVLLVLSLLLTWGVVGVRTANVPLPKAEEARLGLR